MRRRLREGAKLIVVDPREIDLVDSPHVKADFHLPLRPGTNVAVITALAHVVVTEGLARRAVHRASVATTRASANGGIRRPAERTHPKRSRQSPGVGAH